MRILITGSTGFLGSHVAQRLAAEHEVFATTRGKPVPGGTKPIEADFDHAVSTAAWPTVDAIVHLAQSRQHGNFPDGAQTVFAVASLATQTLLDYATRVDARRFIFASTGGLYAPTDRPVRENSVVDIGSGRLAHYFASKRSGELLVAAYAPLLATTTLRIFFCYGPGQRENVLMPRLARSVRDGFPIKLAGDGGLRINPIFVDDAADAVVRLVEREGPDVVNLAGPDVISLEEIGKILGSVLGRQPVFETDATASASWLVADIGLLEVVVGRPRIAPADGLARLAASLRPA
jgi:nucleoside-diphosphate-sugar epimerase